METSSQVEYPIAPIIHQRRSIRSFSNQAVESEKIKSLFEAVRWAPSSVNEQPWTYLYATKGQPMWDTLFASLYDGNKLWAGNAPLLILSMTRKTFKRNDRANQFSHYDLGGANAFLALQAVELGLQIRQMAGYDFEKAMKALNIPDHYLLGAMLAVGYAGDPEVLPEALKARELAPRERYLQDVFVMNKPF